jgi:hypothetical protein
VNSDQDGMGSASLGIFNAARRHAFVQDVLAELSGRSDDLLSFHDVQEQLKLSEPMTDAHLEEIPLDRIVGSVGRYRDFNRAFLPRAQIDPQRWTRIARLGSKAALPPIRVFRIGEVYFVQDGNHRVSVARARNQKTIMASVVDIPVRVPLGPETSPDDLILKAGYAEFLEKTSLDRVSSGQHIEMTRPGSYRSLLQHIEVHQFYMGLRSRYYPSLPEAAAHWYQEVYLPVVERIRASGILAHFPGRTEADLYLWITENRARLQMRYAGQDEARKAVEDFAEEQQHQAGLAGRLRHRLKRFSVRLRRRAP